MAAPKLLFFVTEDWYFCSHRLPLAIAAREAGYEVAVLTRVQHHAAQIEAAGLRLIPFDLSRRGKNPLREFAVLCRLCRVYRREKPDLVHQVALKPVLYGSLAAWLAGVPHVVNALAGLGHLFTSGGWLTGLLRACIKLAFRALLNGGRRKVIVQNPDDFRLLVEACGLKPEVGVLIRGSGVDLAQFRCVPEPEGVPLVVLPTRVLWTKGVGEFVEAARRLKAEGVAARFALVGDPDPENPAAVPPDQLDAWRREGAVECWGRRDDMAEVLAGCHIVCLPSYREGLPKALIEAAAAGRAIVTTDTPGCREVVRAGDNGLLVPARDAKALAEALRGLIADADSRRRMGQRGREIAEAEFSVERVAAETLAVYRALLS